MSVLEKRRLVEIHARISVKRQCELLDLPRSVYYYQPATESAYNLELMRHIDEQYMRTPYYGIGMMYGYLRRRLGYRQCQAGTAAVSQDGFRSDLSQAEPE